MGQAEFLGAYAAKKIPHSLRHFVVIEDVLQDVWIAAFRGFAGFRQEGPDAFDRWLISITQSRLVDAIRRARSLKRGGGERIAHEARQRTTSYLDLFASTGAKQHTPSGERAAKEAVHAVQVALGALPDDHRCAIMLHHINGQSRAEVAMVMQKTRPAVNSLLFRGLRMLRVRLEPAGKFFNNGD